MNLSKHIPALDGLRGLAVLMVILTHCASGWPTAMSCVSPRCFAGSSARVGDLAHLRHGSSYAWCPIIFVVSAFTLTIRPIRRSNEISSYVLRRIARIGPAYWLAGLGYMLLAGYATRLSAPHGVTPYDIAIAGVFGSAWQGGAALAVVPGGWSVACEASFYIVFPLLLWLIDGRVWRALVMTGIATVIAQVRAQHGMAHGDLAFDTYVNPIEQAPVFLCGITAALAAMRSRPSLLGNAALIFSCPRGDRLDRHPSPTLATSDPSGHRRSLRANGRGSSIQAALRSLLTLAAADW